MKLLDTKVDWYEEYANEPELVLIVDKMSLPNEFEYEKINGEDTTLYFAEHENGLVDFFSHSFNNQRGYGGRTFDLKMKDGTIQSIKGPWSSRPGVMNNFFPHCIECKVIERDGDYEDLRHSAFITVKLAHEAAKMAGVKLVAGERHGNTVYVIEEVA